MTCINASIALYQNKKEQVSKAINSFLNTELEVKLYLLDNSPSADLMELARIDKRIEYIFNNGNKGFGKAHNIAMKKSIDDDIRYHLVLNPDVYFNKGVLESLIKYAEINPDVGLIMPKILYPNGKIQYLCKLLPTPFDLIGRRFSNFKYLKKIIDRRNEIYELRSARYDETMYVPNLSGSFMFLRVEAIERVGLFDEKFFMYLEDVDLSRRLYNKYKNLYYPEVCIYHEFQKGSYKNKKLLIHHIISAINYFNKYGWFIDDERDRINKYTLKNLNLLISDTER
jgi:GT2 family glycosyltransferase